MRMVEHRVTAAGNVIAEYEPDGDIEPGSFEAIEPTAAERERRERMAKGDW